MASGRAGPAEPKVVAQAVGEACSALVDRMLADAEGASRVMQVRVTGAESESDAHRAARKVADSLLVKCSLNGADPYWGRVASEWRVVVGSADDHRFRQFFELNLFLERQLSVRGYRVAVRAGFNNITGHSNPNVVDNVAGGPTYLREYGGQARAFNIRLRFQGHR